MKSPRSLLTAALASALLLALVVPVAAQSSYRIIVNDANGISSLNRAQVSRFFLRKVTTWDDGLRVAPVDHSESSRLRETFTTDVHGKDVAAVKAYWNRMIFSGRSVPPPSLDSDRDVVSYVRANPGAIGYVSPGTDLTGVKVVELTN